MEKSLKKDIIINRLPVVIYFILIFAALMVIISAVAPMSNHEPKTTDTYSDFSTGWLNCEESEASLDHLSGTTVIHRTITAADCNKTLFFFAKTSNIKVFIDGVCQYRNNHFCSQFFGKTPGALFVNVLIPAESDGKLLEIEIENPYKDDDSAKLNEMYIGDISEMMDNLGCITDGNNIVPITAAMGYAVKNDNSTKDINEIIREADSRMYEKKRSMKHRKA